jgi:CheY-like chemotaxis protein
VEDTGIGIAPDRQAEIFKSAGLGLSICDRLVRLQRGRLGVNPVATGGSVFWFEVPIQTTPQITHEVTHSRSPETSWVAEPLRILVVDDHDLNLMVARNLVRKCFPHATVIEATRGAQALDILRAQTIDLALIDMLMPEMDGLQLTMALRRHFAPPVCHLPVLALTASNDPNDLGRCLSAGMNGVLLKPLNEKRVVAQISQALTAAAERGQ